ncbi:MAG: methyltransferase domain-containing protein [Proteobacteria bacterium]|nr:methyltransferase domain-containing protein [Pseudomonadota bacterium]
MSQNQLWESRRTQRSYGIDYLFPAKEPLVSNIIDALFLDPDSIVIEFGAGKGYFTLPIATRLEQSNDSGLIFGFEFSEQMIDRLDDAAVELGVSDHIRTWPLARMKEPYTLPLNNSKVDRVLAVNSVQYLDDPLPICREFARILKPGGFALVADWNRPDHNLEKNTVVHSPLPEKLLACLTEVGLGAYSPLSMDGYSWAVRAMKPISLE